MAENQVKVSQVDSVPNWLASKIQGGYGIILTNNGTCLRIDCSGTASNGTIAVDSQDKNLGFLSSKISSGTGISISNTGSALEISANTQTGDHKIVVDSLDTSPGYLLSKLTAGSNVTLTNLGSSIEISSIDTGMLNPMTTLGDIIVGAASGAPDRLPIGSEGQVLTVSSGSPAWATIPTQTGDHKVLVDSSDTNPQYLGVKLKSGAGINISYYNHDKMEIASLGQLKINSSGALGYLTDKLIQGSGITLTKTNNDITIAADTQPGDHKVLASSGDPTPDYLGDKLVQGTGITLTKGVSDITIAADTQNGDHKVLATTDDATGAGALADKLYVFSPLVQSTATAGGVKRVTIRINAGTDGTVLTSNSGSVAWTTPATQTGDHKTIVDSNDTTPDYLASKLTAGSNVTITNNGSSLEISATDTGFANPMTAKGDLIVGGSAGSPYALSMGTAGQVLTSTGSDISWSNLPTKIDWVVNPGLGNGSFNQSVDRTFYVRIYPTFEFKKILDVGIIITGPSASDEWRAAVFDSARNMVAYGTKTGGNVNFQRVTLTMLDDFATTTTNFYYLAISQHVAGTSNSKILTTTVSSPSFCWYEDVELTSGRAMPATSSLTASTSKVPIIGLRGR